MKIIHIPTTVGGHPQSLSVSERKLGHSSVAITLYQNYLAYDTDLVLHQPGDSLLRIAKDRLALLRRLCTEPDVVHFNFGSSLLPNRSPCKPQDSLLKKIQKIGYNLTVGSITELLDLKLIARSNKVIAVTYQGDDARQGKFCQENFPIHFVHSVDNSYFSAKGDLWKAKRIKTFDRYADIIYALNPDLMHVLPKRTKFLPYANIDPKKIVPVRLESEQNSILHVVHAPTHRKVKGTALILEAFERLKSENLPFRYTLVEGMSHAEAMKVYSTADLLVDQLLAGFYGGLAVEAMSIGVPVVSYMRRSDLKFLPEKMRDEIPVISADPESIYRVLKELLTAPREQLKQRGVASRRYVEKWHDPCRVAEQTTRDYRQAMLAKVKMLESRSNIPDEVEFHESI